MRGKRDAFTQPQSPNLFRVNARKVFRDIAGTLPPEFASLINVRVLHLAANYLTGQIPAAYLTAAAFRYNTFLYLYLNTLTGPLPAIAPSSCALCSPRATTPGLPQVDPGLFSGLILEPMRAGYGAPLSHTALLREIQALWRRVRQAQ